MYLYENIPTDNQLLIYLNEKTKQLFQYKKVQLQEVFSNKQIITILLIY